MSEAPEKLIVNSAATDWKSVEYRRADLAEQREKELQAEIYEQEGYYTEGEKWIDDHIFTPNVDTAKTREFITADTPSARRLLRICELLDAEEREKDLQQQLAELKEELGKVNAELLRIKEFNHGP